MTATDRHFLDLDSINANELRSIVDHAKELKDGNAGLHLPLAGKALAMIFEKNSTRTRISFELAIKQLGGLSIMLDKDQLHLGKRET